MTKISLACRVCVVLKSSLVMNKLSHILSTNYGASVTNQPSWNLCAAPIFCLVRHDDDIDDDDDGDIDDDENDDDEEDNEPSWKLYAVTAFCLVDDCSSGATVESDSALSSS